MTSYGVSATVLFGSRPLALRFGVDDVRLPRGIGIASAASLISRSDWAQIQRVLNSARYVFHQVEQCIRYFVDKSDRDDTNPSNRGVEPEFSPGDRNRQFTHLPFVPSPGVRSVRSGRTSGLSAMVTPLASTAAGPPLVSTWLGALVGSRARSSVVQRLEIDLLLLDREGLTERGSSQTETVDTVDRGIVVVGSGTLRHPPTGLTWPPSWLAVGSHCFRQISTRVWGIHLLQIYERIVTYRETEQRI